MKHKGASLTQQKQSKAQLLCSIIEEKHFPLKKLERNTSGILPLRKLMICGTDLPGA